MKMNGLNAALPIGPEVSSAELDTLTLDKKQKNLGMVRCLLYSAIAFFVFFVSITINGKSQIVFGWIYNYFADLLGTAGYWLLVAIIGGNLFANLYSKYIDKGNRFHKLHHYYENDSIFVSFLYALGFIYIVVYAMDKTIPAFTGPEIIVGPNTGDSVVPPIVMGVLWIILVGAFFMPMLLDYGAIEFVGALLEPLMRPFFHVPGKAALDATASFLSSSSLGVIITSRLYHREIYTQKEAVTIATCFSAVSVGFAYLVISTAGMEHSFLTIYVISFLLSFILEAILVRIPPLKNKKNCYVNGREQTEKERSQDARFTKDIFSRGAQRAVKRGATAYPLGKSIFLSLKDSMMVVPKVITMLSAIGISAMILAQYTPIFEWIGYAFQPLLYLLRIPEPAMVAPSLPVGIAEMFLPVLIIANKINEIPEMSRFFICVVSMVQIIFFSETGTVMLTTKLPVKFKELVLLFFMRTLIAMPFAALAAHLFC